jgi:heat shock protein HslJ
MKKTVIFSVLMFLLVFAAACTSAETPTATMELPSATPEPEEPTEEPTPEPQGLPAPEPVALKDVQDILWQWSGLVESDPAAQSVVPDPENYTLALLSDNTFQLQADCNRGSGTYTASDTGVMTLKLGVITLAECGPESLSDQFLALLESVTGYGMLGEQLVLVINDNQAQMMFDDGGPLVEEPEPVPEYCAGVFMESVAIDMMGLPNSWEHDCLPPTTYDDTTPPGPRGLPEHVQINFSVSDPADRQYGDPVLYIIPVKEYIALWEANGDSSAAESIASLQQLLVNQPQPIPTSGLPVLPYEEVAGVNDLAVQGEYLSIKMGYGVRFVGRFSQGPNPVASDNPQLFYIFQGFTEDEQYLISFFYPVTTDALPKSDQVSQEEQDAIASDPQAYLVEKAQELNNLTTSDWIPDLTTLDQVIDSLEFEYQVKVQVTPTPVQTAQLTNVNWQWTDLTQTDPADQSVVPNRKDYVLVFFNDGTLNITADCNYGGGTYSTDGDLMTIKLGVLTQADCGKESLSEEFIALLGQVQSYELTIPRLVLQLKDKTGSLGFANSGSAGILPPGSGDKVPTAVTTDVINLRSGPGNEYPSYSILPVGTRFLVVGVSEDGSWWVVQVPTSVAPNGRGWVNANYVRECPGRTHSTAGQHSNADNHSHR